MYQSFDAPTRPQDGPPRLAALRRELAAEKLAGFFIPRADAHQGEYVAPCDERLSWLTGFTGSAGFCIALADRAGVFIDGRYRVQVKDQVAAEFTPVPWPEVKPGPWLREALPEGGRIGFDPWLHTSSEIAAIEASLHGSGVTLAPVTNLVDRIWSERPAPPATPARVHPIEFAGESSASKRARLAADMTSAGQKAAVLSLTDSLCWLLNIRGGDIARNPVVQAFGILHDDGRLQLFADPAKFDAELRAHLGAEITLAPMVDFAAALSALEGPVRVDPASAPLAVEQILQAAGIEIRAAEDPCILPKARKNAAEVAGMQAAHLRDGAAMVEFLAWLDSEAPKGGLTEIDVVRALENFRRADNALREISFDTICGAGPHGAIVHYRVTEGTNRAVTPGELLLVDSGGQYLDGTTDITRTVAVGTAPEAAKGPFTRVLQGMIALSRARWPQGLAGRDLDALARYPLWLAGMDYDHGTGHGVGAYLCVHEGPARFSRASTVPLEPGMILSNEPGYYREGAFGIRIENLVLVEAAPDLPGADARKMLNLRGLTYVPIDRRLIERSLMSHAEIDWLNAYHAETRALIGPRVSDAARVWLEAATEPL
jgi:Xaa-Pro aminopeptidase